MSEEIEIVPNFKGICIIVEKAGRTGYRVVEVLSNGSLDEDHQSCVTTFNDAVRDMSERAQDWDQERSELERRQAEDENTNVVAIGSKWWRRA